MRLFFISVCALSVMALSGCDSQGNPPWSQSGPGQNGGATVAKNSYTGTVKAEFLVPNPPSDYYRDMKLLEPFGYVDAAGLRWEVPAGAITNGASVPWGFWNIVGGPYDGPYRDAAVIHDYFVENKSRSWEDTNKMFYSAILARGISDTLALTMYAGVRYGGPRWDVVPPKAELKSSTWASLFSFANALAGDATPQPDPAAPAPAPAAPVTPDTKPLVPAEAPAPAVRSLGRSMASDQEMKTFDDLRLWIEREKPGIDEIDKRVEQLRQREGKSSVRVP